MTEPSDEHAARTQRFPGAFRLKQARLIRPLFDTRRDDVGSISRGCIRLLYRIVPRTDLPVNVPTQIGFAPGRLRTAVLRNRIKRLLREVYRVRQSGLVDLFHDTERALTMMIVYRGDAQRAECIRTDLPAALEVLGTRLGETSMSAERRV